ncbi:hypothetical protein JB92DRAFT_3130028 [Gautieria morchelliformis]|nr:hypothetical protein JB92DRAFT_3130028 [Gautieria morchelliformis]
MLHQQHSGLFRQAEAAISRPSNLEMGQVLPVASPPKPSKDAENLKETDDYDQVKRYLDDRANEIRNFDELLVEVHDRQLVERDPEKMCQLIEQQLTLERHIQRLEGESDDIRWQFVSREATITFSDSAAQRLLEIQGQIGQAIGALSALGAGLALSLLFSATRGDLWCMYAAWWLFLIALTVSGAVGMAGSGIDELNKRPSHAEWTARRWTLLGILVSALCVVGGFVAFCIAVVFYDLTDEIATGHAVITGPRPGPWNKFPVQKVFAFVIIFFFEAVFVAGFVRALRPGLRLRNWKSRRAWRNEMLRPSRRGSGLRARTLTELLDDGSEK